MLAVFFGEFLSSIAFAGAPPGAAGPAVGPVGPVAGGKRQGAISFELGYYAPSLKTVNDEMKLIGFPEIGGNLFLSGKYLIPTMAAATPATPHPYVGFSYWSSSSTREAYEDKEKVTLLSFPIGVEVPILTRTLPEQVMLYIDVGGDVILPLYRYETTTGDYFAAWALGYDLGARVGSQFFAVPNVFSIGGSIGYVFLGKTSQLIVYDSSNPDLIDQKLETSEGEKFVLDLGGITLMFDVRLWF